MSNVLFPHFYTGFFQFGYVTNDLEQAMANMNKQYGVKNFLNAGTIPNKVVLGDGRIVENELLLAFANVGEQQVELIQPVNDGSGLYSGALRGEGGFEIMLHHLGCRFYAIEQWQAFRNSLDLEQHTLAFENSGGDFHYLYTDERKTMGHFLEYMWLDGEGAALFDAIPNNP